MAAKKKKFYRHKGGEFPTERQGGKAGRLPRKKNLSRTVSLSECRSEGDLCEKLLAGVGVFASGAVAALFGPDIQVALFVS